MALHSARTSNVTTSSNDICLCLSKMHIHKPRLCPPSYSWGIPVGWICSRDIEAISPRTHHLRARKRQMSYLPWHLQSATHNPTQWSTILPGRRSVTLILRGRAAVHTSVILSMAGIHGENGRMGGMSCHRVCRSSRYVHMTIRTISCGGQYGVSFGAKHSIPANAKSDSPTIQNGSVLRTGKIFAASKTMPRARVIFSCLI